MSRVERLTDRLAIVTERIEMLEAKPLNEKRAARLERLRTRQLIIEGKLMMIEDKFEITYNPEGAIEVEVTDSPFDRTFIGGESLDLQIDVVTGKDNGGTQRRTITTNLVSGDYWDGFDPQVFTVGSNRFIDLDAADTFTIGVKNDKGDLLASQGFVSADFI